MRYQDENAIILSSIEQIYPSLFRTIINYNNELLLNA